ncbi:hypothetical protein GCM10010343_14080 [Streptomyces avidinii]|nr:hypothetical protein GCM10010343_14080 [Streptomyces avidinii]
MREADSRSPLHDHPRRERGPEQAFLRGARDVDEADGRMPRGIIAPDPYQGNRAPSGPGPHDRQDIGGIGGREVPDIQDETRDAGPEQSKSRSDSAPAFRDPAGAGPGTRGQYGVGAQELDSGKTGGHGASPPGPSLSDLVGRARGVRCRVRQGGEAPL